MIRFNCDYAEGAHPAVLEKLIATNLEQTPGYGTDDYCLAAANLIRELCSAPSADVHFLVGGTQTNMTVIAAALRPHQGVIAAASGHINCHETGAIEASGHKVLALPAENGKITAEQIDAYVCAHMADGDREHVVQPGMVYISNPTELGTLYSLAELEAISAACRRHGLPLFLDGARLGYGLAASDNTLSFADLARLCDVFYIGGTKQGALFGEAVVITNAALKRDFRYLIKQRGAMLAKGRLLGLQFLALLEDGLYLRLAREADRLADRLRDAFEACGYPLVGKNSTNQVFVSMPDTVLDRLRADYSFEMWGRADDTTSTVRFCTSWATREENVDALIADIRKVSGHV